MNALKSRILFIGLVGAAVACAHWEPETRPVPEVVADHPDKIMITRPDHSQVIIVEPVMEDSVVSGMRGTPRGQVDRDSVVTVPLDDVALLHRWEGGPAWTVYAVLIGAVVGLVYATGKQAGAF